MKKIFYIYISMCMVSIHTISSKKNVSSSDPQWVDFTKQSVISIASSAPVGSLTGYLNAIYLNRYQNPGSLRLLLSWIIASGTTREAIKHIDQLLCEHNIPHKKSIMDLSAWLASWLLYVQSRTS